MIYILSPTFDTSCRIARRHSLHDSAWWHVSGPNNLLEVRPDDVVWLHPQWSATWKPWDTVHAAQQLRRLNVEQLTIQGNGVL